MSRRRADIQGLRAVAVLLVVLFHAGADVPGGFTGVDVFFAISGFVITRTLVDELGEHGRIDLPRFYTRRIKRLLPALGVMVAVVAVLGILASPFQVQPIAAKTGIFASFFTANAYLYQLPAGYFDVGTTLDPFLHTWTLAVEEQFYVVFPTLLFLAWRFGRRRRGVALTVVGAATAASLALSVWLSHGGSLPGLTSTAAFSFYSSPTRAWEFGLGALLALGSMRLSRFAAEAAGVAGLAAILVGAFAIHDTAHFPGYAALLPAGGAALAIASGSGARTFAARVLSVPPLVWVGDLSYSWYLWHWPAIVYAKALWPGVGWAPPLAAALSLAPAWASFRYVENPIRFNRGIRGRRVVGVAAAFILLPVAACLLLIAAHRQLAAAGPLQAWEKSQQAHADLVRGCDAGAALPGAVCEWPTPQARGEVWLVGDSNAGHFSEPVTEAAARAHLSTRIATYSGCPFLDARIDRGPAAEAACRRFDVDLLRRLVAAKPKAVVIANRTDSYLIEGVDGIGAPGSGPVTFSAKGKAALWRSGLQSMLERLRGAGIPALVVHPVPDLPAAPSECSALRILLRSCNRTVSRHAAHAPLVTSFAVERAAAEAVPGAATLDLEPLLCPNGMCATYRGGIYVYKDPIHLSVQGSLTLTGLFERAIYRLTR